MASEREQPNGKPGVIPLSKLLSLTSSLRNKGCNLPRYPVLGLVTRPDHQIRPPFPAISPQHARTERPARRRGGGHANAQPQRVRPRGARVGT